MAACGYGRGTCGRLRQVICCMIIREIYNLSVLYFKCKALSFLKRFSYEYG